MKKLFLIICLVSFLQANKNNDEKLFWDEVKDSADIEMLKLYKKRYPHGVFETIADIKIKRLLRTNNENSETTVNDANQNEEPYWVKGNLFYKYYGIGKANKHFKGKHYQENLARSRAKRDLQKLYDKNNLTNEQMNEYNELLETKTYIDKKERVYILIYLDNYNLH